MVKELRQKYELKTLLKISELNKQTYFNNVKKEDFDYKNLEVINQIEKIFYENKGNYGYRRITDELKYQGYRVNHKKVQRIMNKLKLVPYAYSSYQGSSDSVIENLIERHFQASMPNEKWSTDVTEFRCFWGKLYLSVILDIYSRDIVSYSVAKHPDYDQIEVMLSIAFSKYSNLEGLIIHSDMGWQYTYYKYINSLKEKGIIQSMSRKGNCLDNAIVESFFGILKKEMFYGKEFHYKSYGELKSAIDEYIDYYNNKRRKHNLNGLTPSEYRQNYYKNEQN